MIGREGITDREYNEGSKYMGGRRAAAQLGAEDWWHRVSQRSCGVPPRDIFDCHILVIDSHGRRADRSWRSILPLGRHALGQVCLGMAV